MLVDRQRTPRRRPSVLKRDAGEAAERRRRALRPERELLEDRLAPAAGVWSAVGFMGPLPPAQISTATTATDSGASMPLGLQYAASEAIGAADAAYSATAAGDGYTLSNATNGYSAYVDAGGLHVSNGSDSWTLDVVGVGYGDAVAALGAGTATVDANRVEYDYGAVSQWYVNGPLGLQQGFTLTERPTAGAAGAPLTLILSTGGLVATADADGLGAVLARADGSASFTYGGLIAYDATGEAVPAFLSVITTDEGQRLSIQVDDAGAQYPLTIDPYVQQAKVTAAVNGHVQYLGVSSSISADGNLAAIGARGGAGSTVNPNGEVYVFSRNGSSWSRRAVLAASDAAAGAEFGSSTAISADGSTIVVGARSATIAGKGLQGAAYIFTGAGSTWDQVQKLTAADGAAGDFLGYSSSINATGTVVAVGAATAKVGNNANQGAVYLYTKSGSTWSQSTKLTAFDGTAGALFGYSTSLSGDGRVVAVGAAAATVGAKAQQGAAYVYSGAVGAWTQAVKLAGSDGAANDALGTSISLNYDGSILLAGAPYADVAGKTDQGAAYAFVRSGAAWSQSSKIIAADGAVNDGFGAAVALSADGTKAAISATGANSAKGAVYVLSRSGTTWTQTARLTASDGAVTDVFGFSAAISADGSTVVSGAPNATVSSNFFQGAAYFYYQAPALTITSSPPSRTTTLGSSTTFAATATGRPGVTVRWQVSPNGTTWTDVAGATQTWYTVTPTLADSGKRYRAVFTDSANVVVATQAATLTVVKKGTVLEISPSFNPRRIGDPLTITIDATSAVAGGGTPDGGTIMLNVGPVNYSGTLVDGKAVFGDIPVLALGTYTITATYDGAGDPNFASSQATSSLVVVRGTAGLVGTVPQNPVNVGTSVTLSAVLTAEGNIANLAGGVVILDNGQPIAFPQLSTSGGVTRATFTTSSLAQGTHRFQFVFLGNPELYAASTGVYELQVNAGGAASSTAPPAETTPIPSGAPAPEGASASGSAEAGLGPVLDIINPGNKTATAGSPLTLTAAPTSAALFGAQWQVSGDAGASWIDILDANSTSFTFTPSLNQSGFRFRAVFTDFEGNSETTTPATLTVVRAATVLKVSTNVNPRRIGDPLTITVDATAAVVGAGTPNGGTVSINIGSVNYSGTLVNGKAVFSNIPSVALGTYAVTASYNGEGDPVFASAQAEATQVVIRGTSALVGVLPSQPVRAGTSVTLSAVLTAEGNIANLAGGVVILDNGQPIAFPQLSTSGGVTRATFTTSSLAQGTHRFQFVFLGNPELYAASTGVYDFVVSAAGAASAIASSTIAPSTANFAPTALATDSAATITFVEALETVDAFASTTTTKNGRAASARWPGLPDAASALSFRRAGLR